MEVEVERLTKLGQRFDIWSYGTFGITCAATLTSDWLPPKTWFTWAGDYPQETMAAHTAESLLD